MDREQDQYPERFPPIAREDPIPEDVILIHAQEINSAVAIAVRDAIAQMGFETDLRWSMPKQMSDTIVWVEMGKGMLWQ